ncbi:MAG: hypothetical protein J6T26_03845, partial [Firmicutes bacterium]|nr:hypothetical protein [Bacillota bacterium]
MNKIFSKTFRRMFRICGLLALFAALIMLGGCGGADAGIEITQQPQDVEVNYPEGATFHVEVAKPKNVASWQWIGTNAEDENLEYVLTGTSATTDTLIVPSTMQDDADMLFRCVITDKKGNVVESEPARLHAKNTDEDITVLYVGDYAVAPGGKLDLSDTELGSGTIEFAADGVNVDFNDVQFDNSDRIYDTVLGPAMGMLFMRRYSYEQEYFFHFHGDCLINNTFFDPDYNSGGVTLNAFFACGDDGNAPTIIFDGDGSLTIKGGSNQIYTDGNVELAMDIQTEPKESDFCDGIRCRSLFIDEGVEAKLGVNGTAVHTEGDLFIYDGAKLDITSSAPHVSQGPTTKSMMFIVGSIYAKQAQINISGYADPENFVPYEAFVATMPGILLAGEGNLNAEGTEISVELSAGESEEPFAMNLAGVYGNGETNAISLSDGAKLDVRINTPEVNGVTGVCVSGIVDVEEGCSVNIDVSSAGEVTALEAERALYVNNAKVEAKAESTTGDFAFGIVCGEADITLDDADATVHSTTVDGVAFAADTGIHEDAVVEYVSG